MTDNRNVMANEIDVHQWTLFDKLMYGGLGYGSFCFPTDFFKVVIAILFPPLGEILNILDDSISADFPYITWESVKKLCEYENLKRFIYSFVLTALFYVPGLVYTLTGIVEQQQTIPKTTQFESNSTFQNANESVEDDISNEIRYEKKIGNL